MKLTLKQVKDGSALPQPIYKVKPYVVLSKDGVVLSAGDINHLRELSDYYDNMPVEVRQHDLHANDNTKLTSTHMTTQHYEGKLAIWGVAREDGMHVVIGADDLNTVIADFGRVSIPKSYWASGGQEHYLNAENAKNCWNTHESHLTAIREICEALKDLACSTVCCCEEHQGDRYTCSKCKAESTLAKHQPKEKL